MKFELPVVVEEVTASFPHPLVFATISGAHLYGFPSPDSDIDLRACHVLPALAFAGLEDPQETEERLGPEGGVELDLVSHDIRKFCRMLLKRNGYVLEQLLSPLVVRTSPLHEELVALVPGLLTRHHAHHYLGFARNQWDRFEADHRVKSLLYVYRVLLTGLHLMRTGRVVASLPELLAEHPLDGVEDLVAAKRAGAEKQTLADERLADERARYEHLLAELEAARETSALPEAPSAHGALADLVRRARATPPA